MAYIKNVKPHRPKRGKRFIPEQIAILEQRVGSNCKANLVDGDIVGWWIDDESLDWSIAMYMTTMNVRLQERV